MDRRFASEQNGFAPKKTKKTERLRAGTERLRAEGTIQAVIP